MSELVKSPPKLNKPHLSGVVMSVIISIGIFLLLPVIQAIDSSRQTSMTRIEQIMIPPPPPPPAPPPKPETKEDEKVEELEEDRQPPTIDQLEILLEGSISDSLTGGVAIPKFDIGESLESIVFELDELDQIPELIPGTRNHLDFRYPRNLRRKGEGGSVSIIFIVDEQGKVVHPTIESATHEEFKAPAMDWVRKWKFRPGEKAGTAVKTRMRIPLKFEI